MGRKIICESCGTIFKEEILGDATICPVCGADLSGDDVQSGEVEHPGWVTWWYLKDKRYNDDYSLWDKQPYHPEHYEVVKEFKAPPEVNPGDLDEVKRILRTYIPDAFAPAEEEPPVRCPYCFSTEYTLMNRGYGLLTGFIGSGKVKRVCNRCKREF